MKSDFQIRVHSLASKTFALILAGLSFASTAHAIGSNLDCIANATGKKVKWSQYWGNDKTDNNVVYNIRRATEIDRIPLREVTLELQADGPAAVSFRKEVVTTEEKARAICERLVVESRPLAFPEDDNAKLEKLAFIRFTKDGWVRADLEPDIQLGLCKVGELRFSCPEADRIRFGGSLTKLEEQLRALVK